MSAREISAALRGHPAAGGYLCSCPVPSHGRGKGDRSPSLSLRDGDDGRLLVKCFCGCDARDVLAELRRRHLLEDAPEAQRSPVARESVPEVIDPCPDAVALWRAGGPPAGTILERYLAARGLRDAPPTLRFLPAYEHIAGRVYLPAMVAAFQAGDRRLIAVQVTMLDPRGDRKAQVRFPRKTFGRMGDGAVRLGPAGETLGVAEGVETGLSAQRLFGIPTWCSLGAGRMHNVAIPDCVRELHLFGDNDPPGRAAVERTRASHRDRRVVVHYPAEPAKDFNDELLAHVDEECAA